MTESTNEPAAAGGAPSDPAPAARGRASLRIGRTVAPVRFGRTAALIVVGVLVLAALFVFLPLTRMLREEDTGEQFYLFPVGTEWTYMNTTLGKKVRSIRKVVKVERGIVWLEEHREEDPTKVVQQVNLIRDGFLVEAGDASPTGTPGKGLYKLGSRKGQRWTSETGVVVRNLGITSVDVRAGHFENVVQTRWELPASYVDYYFAPGVGLVKFTDTMRPDPDTPREMIPVVFQMNSTRELVEFKRPP